MPLIAMHRNGTRSCDCVYILFKAQCDDNGIRCSGLTLRLAGAFIFSSSEPVTPMALEPLLLGDLDPSIVFKARQRHCPCRGEILVQAGGGWAFRKAAARTSRMYCGQC